MSLLGITRKDFARKHFATHEIMLPDWKIRQQILPMLETAGLIQQEKDELGDKRSLLIFPTKLMHDEKINSRNEQWGK